MRAAALTLLLLLAPAAAQEPPPPEPDHVAKLPAALRPGASAVFDRKAGGGKLAATVRFRTEADAEKPKARVRLVLESATADLGPLTTKDRLTAVLDAETKRIRSFVYEVGGKTAPLRVVSDLGPDPEREGGLVFHRYTYAKDRPEPRKARSRLRPEGLWTPDLLEPFLIGLLEPTAEKPADLPIVTVEKGRLLRTSARYVLLGDGSMDLDGEKTPCRILRRTRAREKGTVYVRASDSMPFRHDPARLTIRTRGERPR